MNTDNIGFFNPRSPVFICGLIGSLPYFPLAFPPTFSV